MMAPIFLNMFFPGYIIILQAFIRSLRCAEIYPSKDLVISTVDDDLAFFFFYQSFIQHCDFSKSRTAELTGCHLEPIFGNF